MDVELCGTPLRTDSENSRAIVDRTCAWSVTVLLSKTTGPESVWTWQTSARQPW